MGADWSLNVSVSRSSVLSTSILGVPLRRGAKQRAKYYHLITPYIIYVHNNTTHSLIIHKDRGTGGRVLLLLCLVEQSLPRLTS
jgi:hypothetical protein